MRSAYPIELHEGRVAETTDVWAMLNASLEGDIDDIRRLAESNAGLLTCQFDYTSPLHFAVREGHFEVVSFFVESGALDPGYWVHPFKDPLMTVAEDRGLDHIAQYLRQNLQDPSRTRNWGDVGKVDFKRDEIQIRFQELVDRGTHVEVEAMLKDHPELALDETAFWGEGILAIPAKDGDHRMIELLMSRGARVPELSKWGARYYFKHYDTARFLLENGMDANHMNWREFTLLHDMAFVGDLEKAKLLLDFGADIDPIDDEYSSTPLGYAVRWGNDEVVDLLLKRGADRNKAGAEWATPLAWASKKSHPEIEKKLRP
jgi:ankyrin repeat protein